MEQWEKNYYISAIAGATNGSSLVVMSKGLFRMLMFSFSSAYYYILHSVGHYCKYLHSYVNNLI